MAHKTRFAPYPAIVWKAAEYGSSDRFAKPCSPKGEWGFKSPAFRFLSRSIMVMLSPVKRRIVGSNPTGAAIFARVLQRQRERVEIA